MQSTLVIVKGGFSCEKPNNGGLGHEVTNFRNSWICSFESSSRTSQKSLMVFEEEEYPAVY
uniref:Uncharacterized protein n=1 Tax=Arcella intermedia TaxID=1963864 RepID=A0A6B2LUQ3_9EUKA